MRYIYIYNSQWVEVAKIGAVRYNLLSGIVDFTPVLHQNIFVKIPLEKLEIKIEEMLPFRLQDTPEYENRFKKEDIFQRLIYKGKTYKLCNSGFDNSIIFLINIYNAGIKNTDNFIIYTSNNHREFEEWRKTFL
jgi:hypothetical protein